MTKVSPEARRRAARDLIESHDAVFRRTARRYSICADDAEDAYQRALEILLTKAPPIGGDNLVRWMQTVTKREALGVRRQRERLLSAPRPPAGEEDRDPLDAIASEGPEPDERAASKERVARSGEALRALKPQEVRALTLKAEGYSYAEIGEITGWTHTKINRCMAEGRKRFLEVFDELEQGGRCGEMAEALSAIADGERDVLGADAVHVHLRSCGACRAKLRAFRAVPDRVLELMPFAPAADLSTRGQASHWLGERFAAATEKVKELGYSVTARGSGDGPASQIAASGGTRGAGMAAIGKALALCGATAAGGAACVAGGVVTPPVIGSGVEEKPAIEAEQRPAETPIDQAEVAAPPVAAEPVAQPQAPSAPAPEPAPAPTPVEQKSQQFNFEQAAAPPAPAPAPTSAASSAGRPRAAAAAVPGAAAQEAEGSASSESVPWPRRLRDEARRSASDPNRSLSSSTAKSTAGRCGGSTGSSSWMPFAPSRLVTATPSSVSPRLRIVGIASASRIRAAARTVAVVALERYIVRERETFTKSR